MDFFSLQFCVSNYTIRTEDSFLPCKASALFQQVWVGLVLGIGNSPTGWTHVHWDYRISQQWGRIACKGETSFWARRHNHNQKKTLSHYISSGKSRKNLSSFADLLPWLTYFSNLSCFKCKLSKLRCESRKFATSRVFWWIDLFFDLFVLIQ